MSLSISSHSPTLNLQRLPPEALLRILYTLNGLQLAEVQTVSKKINDFVKHHENYLFERCVFSEYPREHFRFNLPEIKRIDWKYIYISIDQYNVTLSRAKNHRSVLEYHENFKMIDFIFGVIETAFAAVGGIMNITKVAVLGFSDTRGLVNAWIAANPNASRQDAQIAIELIKNRPQ